MSRYRAFGIYIMDEQDREYGTVKVGKASDLGAVTRLLKAARVKAARIADDLNTGGPRADRALRELGR